MNTHQKVFFSGAVAFGFIAAAFASSPTPTKVTPVEMQVEQAMVIGHRSDAAPQEVIVEKTWIIGHRNDSMVASRTNAANKTLS